METFTALLAICAGNSPVIAEFPSVTRSFDGFFICAFDKRLSKAGGMWDAIAPIMTSS